MGGKFNLSLNKTQKNIENFMICIFSIKIFT